MNKLDAQIRRDAVRSLINIAILEGFLIAAVVVVYLYTGNIVHLVGGIVGASLISAPLFLRWMREHRGAMTQGTTNKQIGTELD